MIESAPRHPATERLWAWIETADLVQETKDEMEALALRLDAELFSLDNVVAHMNEVIGDA